jgi:hypothetical protein
LSLIFYENGKKTKLTNKSLSDLPKAICLEKEMAACMG